MTELPPEQDRRPTEHDAAVTHPGPTLPGSPPRPSEEGEREGGRGRLVALTWFLTSVATVLALALAVWPYGKACGLELTFYVGAAALTCIAGMAAAIASWHCRRGFAHSLSLLVAVWALIVIAGEVLPRVGYTKVERAWLCP